MFNHSRYVPQDTPQSPTDGSEASENSASNLLVQKAERDCDPPDADKTEDPQRISDSKQEQIVNGEWKRERLAFPAKHIQDRDAYNGAGNEEPKDEAVPFNGEVRDPEAVENHCDYIPGQRQKDSRAKQELIAGTEIKKTFGPPRARLGAAFKFDRSLCLHSHGFTRSGGSCAPETSFLTPPVHERDGYKTVRKHNDDGGRKAG